MRFMAPLPLTLASSSVPEDDAPPWSATAPYAVGERVLSAGRVYERTAAGTSATPPADEPAHWLDVGPSNRQAMFDDAVDSATTADGGLTVTINLAGTATAVALLGVVGTTVSVGGRTLTVPAPVAPARSVDLLVDGLSGSSLSVFVNGPAAVSVGYLAAGVMHTLGDVQPGVQIGLTDHSRKDTDAFGVTTITPRGYSRRVQGLIRLPLADVDRVAALLEGARSAIGWWGFDERHASLCALGYFKDWQIELREATTATATLSVEALVRDDLAITAGQVIAGATRPGNVTGLRAGISLAGQVPLRWDANTEADYRETELRVGDSWATGAPLFTGAADAYSWAPGAAGTYSVHAMHRNRAGLESAAPAAIAVTLTPEDLATATSWDVEIESTNGDTFRVGQGTQTTLIAHAFKNGINVTDVLPASQFRWRRVSRRPQPPPNDDERWNQLYATGYRQILISVDDVAALATFHCEILDA